jgi:hypothetical protein
MMSWHVLRKVFTQKIPELMTGNVATHIAFENAAQQCEWRHTADVELRRTRPRPREQRAKYDGYRSD